MNDYRLGRSSLNGFEEIRQLRQFTRIDLTLYALAFPLCGDQSCMAQLFKMVGDGRRCNIKLLTYITDVTLLLITAGLPQKTA